MALHPGSCVSPPNMKEWLLILMTTNGPDTENRPSRVLFHLDSPVSRAKRKGKKEGKEGECAK